MSIKLPYQIAKRYLWSRKGEAAITVITIIAALGVAIGVATLNVVMAVMTGFQIELKEKILGSDAHIVVRQFGGMIDSWHEAEGVIKNIDGVKSSSPFTLHQALIKSDGHSSGILLRGIPKGSASAKELIKYMPSEDALSSLFNPKLISSSENGAVLPSIVIGEELSNTAKLYPGSIVSIMSTQTTSTPFGLVPRFRRFQVSSVYSSGLIEYESGLAYIDIKEAKRFFRMGDTITGFEVRVDDIDSAPILSRKISDTLLSSKLPGYYARNWTESNKAFFEAIKLEKKVYFIVLLLIVVMASFSIVSSLVMIVLEKRKDIAVLRTMGAKRSYIARVFNIQGAVIGAIGVIAGTILGMSICFGLENWGFKIDERIFQMSTLPIQVEPINVISVAVAAFIICCIATIYPARRASLLNPAEVLRYE